jgi:hypothetical protein
MSRNGDDFSAAVNMSSGAGINFFMTRVNTSSDEAR